MKWQFVPTLTTFVFILLFVSIISISIFASPNSCWVDFERWNSNAPYSRSMANKDFGYNCYNWILDNSKRATISSQKDLLVLLPANKKGLKDSGIRFNVRFEPALEYSVEYDILFEKGFEWLDGGYLPGIGGGSLSIDGNNSDFSNNESAFSAIMMWQKDGLLVIRLKQDSDVRIIETQFKLETDKRYHIKENLISNLSSSNDGKVDLWIDDKLILSKSQMQWSYDPKYKADNLLFCTYFDDKISKSLPSKNLKIRFDNFLMKKVR